MGRAYFYLVLSVRTVRSVWQWTWVLVKLQITCPTVIERQRAYFTEQLRQVYFCEFRAVTYYGLEPAKY
jgi:hypothetical protein